MLPRPTVRAMNARSTGGRPRSASVRASACSKSPTVSTIVPSRSTMAAWIVAVASTPGRDRTRDSMAAMPAAIF